MKTHRKISENSEIYTAGKHFKLPPALQHGQISPLIWSFHKLKLKTDGTQIYNPAALPFSVLEFEKSLIPLFEFIWDVWLVNFQHCTLFDKRGI